jgi:soluble lytic murein transglycosylase-like protein
MFLLLALNQNTSVQHSAIIKKVEQKYNIPSGLLHAIMQVESKGHPFAIYSHKKGKRQSLQFKNVDEAVNHVMLLQSLGTRNINVGCMQINLKCHKSSDLALWFSPEYNINYAGRFLKELHRRMGSWKNAVAYYHSGSKEIYHEQYLTKVNKFFGGGDLWSL